MEAGPRLRIRRAIGYARRSDLSRFFDFLSPMRYAFLLTVATGRPSRAATWAVGLFGKSFFSKLMSLFDHSPLTSLFFAIA